MTKLLMCLGSFIGGSIGWALGEHFGIMTAFIISMIGTGAGIYAGRKVADRFEF